MLVLAIIVLLLSIAGLAASLAMSPLFRIMTVAIDSWADCVQGEGSQVG